MRSTKAEMNGYEALPLTLPDTQDAESICLTQSQDQACSQQKQVIWGRLCPAGFKLQFQTVELTKDVYTLGRSDNCDIRVTSNELKATWLGVMSKVHFKITREYINNDRNTYVVYLEDLSQNGTIVNKKKVGKGNKVVLESNDVISLVQPHVRVYVYMSTTAFETNDLPLELKSKYSVSYKLGSGACGEVKLVFSKIGCKRFAMKTIMKLTSGTNGQKHPLNDPAKIMNEVEILKSLKHPNIVRMEEIVDTPRAMYIVLELMEGGELFDRIRGRGKLSEISSKIIFYQVVLAVHYLHGRGITHRDLKPENILLASNLEPSVAKISDFGLSKFVDTQTMMKTFCGTPMYVAPEILLTMGLGTYTNQVDVWSLGVILYVCLSGSVPFNSRNKHMTLQDQIQRGHYSFPESRFGNVSPKAIDLIKRMMTVNPKRRITISQVMLHPWLQDRELHDVMDTLISKPDGENIPPCNVINEDDYDKETFKGPLKRVKL